MLRAVPVSLLGLLAAGLSAGCLPGDERPVPASIELAVEAQATSSGGFVSDDGWTLRFERLLAALGTVRLEGDGCNPYNEAWYSRVFDFAQPSAGPSKVALVHGIGDCRLEFRLRAPQDDSILGPGVVASDVDVMRAEVQDAWVAEPEDTSVRVRGTADKDGRSVRFDWSFRKRYDIEDCIPPAPGAASPSYLDLESSQALSRTAQIDASALFRVPAPLPPDYDEDDLLSEDPAAGVPTAFQMFADADVGLGGIAEGGSLPPGDGVVTLEELAYVDADTGEVIYPSSVGGLGPDAVDRRTLADVLYNRMVPAMVRLDGSACVGHPD